MRAEFGDDVAASKQPKYSLTTVPNSTPRLSNLSTPTPTLNTNFKSDTPVSAPAAAGRSPARSKRQIIQPRKRFNPPAFCAKPPSLSISAALSGTLAHKKAKKVRTIEDSKPKSWLFDIFEETEAQQDYTVNEWTMTQSACILDISDDEGKAQERADRGKENIPPSEFADIPTVLSGRKSSSAKVTTSRKDMMTDEPRTPLSDLNPTDYYADGLDATSVVLVSEDAAELEQSTSIDNILASESAGDFSLKTQLADDSAQDLIGADISNLLATSAAARVDHAFTSDKADVEKTSELVDIEIWESESAKDEEEKVGESFFVV